MQAVILAAGRGTRMGELTAKVPKPMLTVAGKTLLEHKFDILPEFVDEIVLVVGYLAEVIKNRFHNSYKGKKISYVTQENPVGGTADALWYAKDLLKGKFLVLNGDDIYSESDMRALCAHEWAILVKRVSETAGGGKVVMDMDGHVVDIVESKYHNGGPGAVNTNTFALDLRLFKSPQIAKAEGSSELGLPQTVLAASKEQGVPLNVVEATGWIQIKNPEALARAEEALKA